MSKPDYWLIRGPEELDMRLKFLRQALLDLGMWPCRLDIKKYNAKRSLNQNALMWMWFQEIADHLTRKGHEYTKDDVHDLMCHKFLGYEDRRIGELVIENQLRTTSPLDTGEMHRFLELVEAWAADKGCMVTIPIQSQYYKLQQEQLQ
jgi:hypothetical protein